ncbi:MAG: hypothetical protein AAF629_17245 [Chloroflexota bacterium]
MYDITGTLPVEKQMTKAVFRERLINTLETLNATVNLSDEDGAVEFTPAAKNRGKHPLKNITVGRISLFVGGDKQTYVQQIRYQISLLQMRISLVTICLFVWAWSLIRFYNFWAPLAFTILAWLFGYLFSMMMIRSRFKELLSIIQQ